MQLHQVNGGQDIVGSDLNNHQAAEQPGALLGKLDIETNKSN